MELPNFHAAHPRPQPFRPSLFQPTSPSRVSSESQLAADGRKLQLQAHRHHSHHKPLKSRHHAKEVVQSAVQLHPPTSFGDLLKQAKGSSGSPPSQSRRPSLSTRPDVNSQGVARERSGATPPPKPVRLQDVERQRAIVKAGEEELRSSLQSLSDQSIKTSRRLDDTYYSLLEKLSQLRQTIGNLQELSNLTKELHKNFQSDTEELAGEVQGQFEGFNNFENKQDDVSALEERIRVGRGKADVLKKRLADAKERVEARARTEAEWEARTTHRLRILWSILGAVAGLIVMMILFHQFKPIRVTKDPNVAALDFASRSKVLDAPIPESLKEAIMQSPTESAEMKGVHESSSITQLAEDHRMRIFDEL